MIAIVKFSKKRERISPGAEVVNEYDWEKRKLRENVESEKKQKKTGFFFFKFS